MAIFKCKICGGSLDIQPGESIATCEYCGTKQTLPRLDNEKKANLYDRANHFRRNNDYDKAMGIYETILNEDSTDAEAYWSILLCKYGIEYVEDPSNHKHVPTVNRAQYTSIFDDEDYKSAIQYADSNQREIYEAEANTINDIQKGILDISAKEEPFDVFICYKETDASGRRTKDSVLATELYHELTRDGFKVFFSRITLEDKLGTAYEPYIFAALNSAKVMVVVGTKPEHFNAVWVRNEWSRFLSLIKNGAKKTLIPAYRDMDPYDLPEEFSHLQAQDMSKLGFMQDLIRGIKKIVDSDESKSAVKETVVVNAGNANTASLLKRSFMFLEDGEFDRADEFCEQVLNRDPENAQAYLGKLMAELKVETIDGLVECKEPFEENVNYKKIIRFGDAKLKERLSAIIDSIIERNESDRIENEYQQARISMGKSKTPEDFMAASKLFSQLGSYKDSSELEALCLKKSEEAKLDITYNKANNLCEDNDLSEYKYDSYPAKFAINKTEEAIRLYESILDYKDSAQRVQKCRCAIEDFKKRAEDYRIEQEKMTEAMRIQNEKKNKIIKIFVIAIVMIIGISFCIYTPIRLSNNKERIPVIENNLVYKTYSHTTKKTNGNTYNDTFVFYSDKTGIRKSNWTDSGNFTKDFSWHVKIPLFGSPFVVINYDESENEDYTFTIFVDSDNRPTAIKGKNCFDGITLNADKSNLDWVPYDSTPDDSEYEYYKIELGEETNLHYLLEINTEDDTISGSITLYHNEISSLEGGRITGRMLRNETITWLDEEKITGKFNMNTRLYEFRIYNNELTITAMGDDDDNLSGIYKQAEAEQ